MKTAHRSFVRTPLFGVFLVFFCFAFIATTHAAMTPSLGLASTFGVLSDTFTATGASSTILGDVGYTTTSGAYTVGSGTEYGSSAPYAQAGNDQAVALATLDSELCTFTFSAGAVDLATDTTHGLIGVYTPGVYCITGAMSVGTHGIVLGGTGTYIFRSSGALTTVDNSVVSASGVSSCDIFWTPNGATTLGANSTFIGTVIPVSQDITIGTLTSWFGQALTFGHTVTIDTSSIHSACTIGSAPIPTGTLSVINQVVNTGGGTAVASDFQLHVTEMGSDVAGSPDVGVVSPGRAYTLIAPALYTVSEDANALYTQSFSGDCDVNGIVALISNGTSACTVVNTYSIPVVVPPIVPHNAGHPPFPNTNPGPSVIVTPSPIIFTPTPIVTPPTTIEMLVTPVTPVIPIAYIPVVVPIRAPVHFPNTGVDPDARTNAWSDDVASFFARVGTHFFVPAPRTITHVPVRLVVSSIHLDAPIEAVGITNTDALAVPKDFGSVGWFSQGPRIGEAGNAVIDGHYGWKQGAPAIFNLIHILHRGDVVSVVDDSGQMTDFRVHAIATYDAQADASAVFASVDTKSHLVLVTCSGEWISSLHTYSNRTAVFADKITSDSL